MLKSHARACCIAQWLGPINSAGQRTRLTNRCSRQVLFENEVAFSVDLHSKIVLEHPRGLFLPE